MSFRPVFIAVVVAFGLIVSAFLVNRARPRVETDQPSAAFVRASGKCAECHSQQQYSVVHEYELSRHAQKGVNCLDCHQPADGQSKKDHHGFVVSTKLTAGNCRSCHEPIYQEFLRSRHAATSWAAVFGEEGLKPEQVAFAERYQPGGVRRPPHPLTRLEGPSASTSGCAQCHSVGRPNEDGTIGTCTACHTRHTSSVAIARLPTTCGQCHMGPDHSQLEIYEESKHGVIFHAQEKLLNLDAPPKTLTTTGHVRADVRDVPLERDQRPESDARSVGASVVLPRRSDHQAAAQPRARAGGDEADLHPVPHDAARGPCVR